MREIALRTGRREVFKTVPALDYDRPAEAGDQP
jgi:hypothetical protein